MKPYDYLRQCAGFEWDEGNDVKNWSKHDVTTFECEEVFFHQPLALASDEKHSKRETRFRALGKTTSGRWLFIAFTVRKDKVRIISARDMTKGEAREYKEYEKRKKV